MKSFPRATLLAGMFFLGVYVGRGTEVREDPMCRGAEESIQKAINSTKGALAAADNSNRVAEECLALLRQDDKKLGAATSSSGP